MYTASKDKNEEGKREDNSKALCKCERRQETPS